MTKEEFRRLLQEIIDYLPSPVWPLENRISRKNARILLANFFGYDPEDPNLVTKAAQKLNQMTDDDLVSTLPPNLKAIVQNYDEHLKELESQREESLRRIFTRFDENTRTRQERLVREFIKRLQEAETQLPEEQRVLVRNQRRATRLGQRVAEELALLLPQTTRVKGPIALSEKTYQQTLKRALPKIIQILTQDGIQNPEITASHLTNPQTAKETLSLAQALAADPRETYRAPPTTELPSITPKERKVIEAKEDLARKVNAELINISGLAKNPRERQELSKNIVGKTSLYLQVFPRKEITQEEYKEVLENVWRKVGEDFEAKGVVLSKPQTEELVNNLVKNTQKEAAIITTMAPRYYLKEQLIRMAQEPEGVPFSRVYALLNPPVAKAEIASAAYTPRARAMGVLAPYWSLPEVQEMIEERLFVEDFDAEIERLYGLGYTDENPQIKLLKIKRNRLFAQQKVWLVRDGKEVPVDKDFVKVLKIREYPRRLLGRERFDQELGLYLRSYVSPIWAKEDNYPWRLRRVFTQIGLATGLYEKVEVAPGRTTIRFALTNRIARVVSFGRFQTLKGIRTKIYQKTLGKIVTPLIKRLATSRLGGWLATKLGIHLGAAAVGTAVAPGVGTAISIAVSAALEIGGKVLGKIWEKVKTVFREPEKAIAALGIGVGAAILLPMPIALIAVAPIVLGSIGLLSWGIASAGTILGGFATQVTTFFVVLATAPITAPIAMLVVLILGILAATTFFIVMTTAGAFILPVGPVEIVEEAVPPPPTPPDIPPPPGLTFRWPVDNYFLCSSNYGHRTLTLEGVTTCDYHEGIDIPTPAGTPVYSTADGEVVDMDSFGGYGIYVVVKHNGLYSFYAHLLATSTYIGAKVDQSTVIGLTGNSGRGTGPHLHFGFSNCGEVPGCFNRNKPGSKTPDPCGYVGCPSGCGYRDRATGCPGL